MGTVQAAAPGLQIKLGLCGAFPIGWKGLGALPLKLQKLTISQNTVLLLFLMLEKTISGPVLSPGREEETLVLGISCPTESASLQTLTFISSLWNPK